MLWEALALEGFGKLLKSFGGFGRLWLEHSMSLTEALGGVGKFWEPLGSFGRVWKALGGFGRLLYASESVGRFWKALEGMGRLREAFGCFGMLWKVGSLALVQWMIWKVLDALGVFERYGRLLEDFRKL